MLAVEAAKGTMPTIQLLKAAKSSDGRRQALVVLSHLSQLEGVPSMCRTSDVTGLAAKILRDPAEGIEVKSEALNLVRVGLQCPALEPTTPMAPRTCATQGAATGARLPLY